MFSSEMGLVYQFSNIFGTTNDQIMRVINLIQKDDPGITLVKLFCIQPGTNQQGELNDLS